DAFEQKKLMNEQVKNYLTDAQSTMLEIAEGAGVEPGDVSDAMKGKAKFGIKMKDGGRIAKDGDKIKRGKWEYKNTDTSGLDYRIKNLVTFLEDEGFSGYSGPKSGVSQRNTLSGRKSRH